MNDEKFKIAEEKLYDYQKIKVEIKALELDIKEIQNEYAEYKNVDFFNGIYEENNEINNDIKIEHIQNDKRIINLKKEIVKKTIQIQKIDNSLELLDENEKKIVKYRYLINNGKAHKWEYISSMVSFSVPQCKKMRVNIINKIKDVI